jgi:hypothetical protein
MRRQQSTVLAALTLALAVPASRADDRHVFEAAVDLSLVAVSSPFTTWLDEGQGKLRFDEDDGALQFSRAFLEYRGRLAPTVVAHAVVNIEDSKDRVIDLTEAFIEWRPVPSTPWRLRTRFGAFYPKLSLENVDAGWSSPYALSASAINTWIGEELRTVGGEARVSRSLPDLPFTPEISLEGAVFYGNDPTGALLNTRGWSIGDRQTGLTSALPLPQVPAIEPWIPSPPNPDGYHPFEEIDHNPGFYVGAEWRAGESFRLKVFRYDNHGDPEAEKGEDYAWDTSFTHVGLQFTLPGDIGVIGQWIDGRTQAGEDLGPWRVWDSGFDARYLLLTRSFGRHRLTARYDDFDVQPINDPDKYTNRDRGHAWTASWLYAWSEQFRLGAEYLTIATEHCETEQCAWVFNGLPRTSRQNQLQFSLRWQFRE